MVPLVLLKDTLDQLPTASREIVEQEIFRMANCMPFGSGKSNDYWINQTVGAFTLEEERSGAWRTIVAVVMTPNMFLNDMNVPELIQNYDVAKIISRLPDAVQSSNRQVADDNIERAPNDTFFPSIYSLSQSSRCSLGALFLRGCFLPAEDFLVISRPMVEKSLPNFLAISLFETPDPFQTAI